MSKSTKQKQEEQLNILSNADEILNKNSNTELFTRENIPTTPFSLVGSEEKGYFIAIGYNRITEYKKTKDEALKELKENSWNIITTIISVITERVIKQIKIDKEIK